MKTISTLFLFVFILGAIGFSQDSAKENEDKIKLLQQELLELEKILAGFKSSEETSNEILDDETKDYIRKVVGAYVKENSVNASDISFLKGQIQMLQTSVETLKKDVVTDNSSLNVKLDMLNDKVAMMDNSSPEKLSDIKTEIISIKAQLKASNAIAASGEGGSAKDQLIIQQQEEIALLQQEVKNLRSEVDLAKQQVRFSSSEELRNLKDQNIQYKEVIQSQQGQIQVLTNKVEFLESQIEDKIKLLQQLSFRVEELAMYNKKVANESFKKINESNIHESIDELDDMNSQYNTNKKIENLAKEVIQLKTLVATGEVNEVTGKTVFNVNTSGGYHIIVASRKSEEAIKQAQADYSRMGHQTEIIQNLNKTWYHLSADRLKTRDEAGSRVSELRNEGFKGAWWIYNDQE
jgi:chromosome segregation ATPase